MQAWAHALEMEVQRWEEEQAEQDNEQYEYDEPGF